MTKDMICTWKWIVLSASIEILRLPRNYVKCYFMTLPAPKGQFNIYRRGDGRENGETINFLPVLKGGSYTTR